MFNVRIISLILLLISSYFIFAEKFTFKYVAGNKQIIDAMVTGKMYINKKFLHDYSEYYKIIRTINEVREDSGLIEDEYYIYNQNKSEKNKVLEVKDTPAVNYMKNKYGNLTVYDNAIYPTIRNVPIFPDIDMKPGYNWIEKGTEIQEMFDDKVISVYPIVINYTFVGYENMNDKKLAKFKYEYSVKAKNSGKNNMDPRVNRVEGSSSTIMYFDRELGTQVKEEYSRNYYFLIENSSEKFTLTFVDTGVRSWHKINPMNNGNIIDDIKRRIHEQGIDDIDVIRDDRGINIRIENILFLPDSVELMHEENERISKVSEILKNYKDKGILIIGHTALSGTKEARQKLSVERAKAIAEYLVSQSSVDPLKISILGKGATEPISDNSTEEGKKKNRRVEIFILEE